MSLINATFARYNGRCVIILNYGTLQCVVRYYGQDMGFTVNTVELTEF